ncbi:MAG: DUF1294 domain-containing protein [Clostridiales bacterium]|nr:DUF1294 domain-containing protein [Clostridiales bacterium]
MKILLAYFVLVNLIALILYGVDKVKAVRGSFRIPEKVLLEVMVAGGVFGAILGMLLFRHKIRKPRFIIVAVISSILYLAIAAIIIYKTVA